MSNEEKRIFRTNLIYAMIKRCNDKKLSASKEKIIALFALDHGISRRTTIEYLTILKNAEKIEIDGDDLWIKRKPQEAKLDMP